MSRSQTMTAAAVDGEPIHPPERVVRQRGTLRVIARWTTYVLFFTLPSSGTVVLPVVGSTGSLVGIAVLATGGATLILEGRRWRFLDVHVLLGLFAFWALLSTIWTIDAGASESSAVDALQIAAFALLAWELADTVGAVLGLVRAFVAGTVVACFSILAQYATVGTDIERYRLGNLTSNDIAFTLSLAIPLAWYLAVRTNRRGEAVLATLVLPLALFTIVLTASRSALIVVGIALLVVPATMTALRPPVRLLLTLVIVAAVAYGPTLLPAAQIARLSTAGSELRTGDLNARIPLWQTAVDVFEEHPAEGVGAGALGLENARRLGRDSRAHNTFLSVAAELGLLGLTLLCLVLLAVVLHSRRAALLERRVAFLTMTAVIVGLQVRHWEYRSTLWAVVAIVLGMAAVRIPVRPSSTTPIES